MQTMGAERMAEGEAGICSCDTGGNAVGPLSSEVRARRGSKITFGFAGTVKPGGELNTVNLHFDKQSER